MIEIGPNYLLMVIILCLTLIAVTAIRGVTK